jgi:hypothetical protein
VRQNIVEVLGECEGLLSAVNVASAEEVLKRVSAVLHSNDSLARALALRAISHLAELATSALEVQHLVRLRFQEEGADGAEALACLEAVEALAARSAAFAGSLLPRLAGLLARPDAPPARRLRLLRLLPLLARAPAPAADAHALTMRLLLRLLPPPASALPHARALLDASTRLALSSPARLPEQLALLLRLAAEPEPAPGTLQAAAMRCLSRVARRLPHALRPEPLLALVPAAARPDLLLRVLRVLPPAALLQRPELLAPLLCLRDEAALELLARLSEQPGFPAKLLDRLQAAVCARLPAPGALRAALRLLRAHPSRAPRLVPILLPALHGTLALHISPRCLAPVPRPP